MEPNHGDQEYKGLHPKTIFSLSSHSVIRPAKSAFYSTLLRTVRIPVLSGFLPNPSRNPTSREGKNVLINLPAQPFLYSLVIIRLWHDLTQAITTKDMNKATDAKMAVEEAQREQRRKMEDQGTQHVQTFFEHRNDRWVPKIEYVYSIYSLLYLLTSFLKSSLRSKVCRTGRR